MCSILEVHACALYAIDFLRLPTNAHAMLPYDQLLEAHPGSCSGAQRFYWG